MKYYKGFTNDKGQRKEGTIILELKNLADTKPDFSEQDIMKRSEDISNQFLNFLKTNDLLKQT